MGTREAMTLFGPALTEEAVKDLKRRTLSEIPNALARLIYLASLRDYSTGQYHHAGLSDRFGEPAAVEAMERCHTEVFGELALGTVEGLYQEMVSYLDVSSPNPEEAVEVWLRLRLFRVLAPITCNHILQDMFASHLKCALRAVRCRPGPAQKSQPVASQPQ